MITNTEKIEALKLQERLIREERQALEKAEMHRLITIEKAKRDSAKEKPYIPENNKIIRELSDQS